MVLFDNFDIEGGNFRKDPLSDNMYIARYRVTCNGVRDGFEVHYMPDEKGLMLYSSTTDDTYVFDTEEYNRESYDKKELSKLASHFKMMPDDTKCLIDTIFEDAFEAAA